MFVFRKIWRALFSWNTRFEIRPFALLPMNCYFDWNHQETVARAEAYEISIHNINKKTFTPVAVWKIKTNNITTVLNNIKSNQLCYLPLTIKGRSYSSISNQEQYNLIFALCHYQFGWHHINKRHTLK